MLIPLGILASSGAGGGGAFELISTATPNGINEVSFTNLSSLSSTYKHLQLRVTGRLTWGATSRLFVYMRFNDDSGTTYAQHTVWGNGGSVQSQASTTELYIPAVPASLAEANVYSAAIIDIVDPFSTSKNKTTRALSGFQQAGGSGDTQGIYLRSGLWNSTAAINKISVASLTPTDYWVAGSRLSLYGIKG